MPDWRITGGPGSPAMNDVDLLTVLEHELGHVLGLTDNDQAGDLLDITLGLGVRRAPMAQDLAAIGQGSSTLGTFAVAGPAAVVLTGGAQNPGSITAVGTITNATVDAALASIVSAPPVIAIPMNPSRTETPGSGPWAALPPWARAPCTTAKISNRRTRSGAAAISCFLRSTVGPARSSGGTIKASEGEITPGEHAAPCHGAVSPFGRLPVNLRSGDVSPA